ncbi:MAG TPA: GNAT family N-acetyltransferase [Rhizomicrobium sp.]|nr:GNAT family N-acetyltransferase [Rhizomicrobium sp.]
MTVPQLETERLILRDHRLGDFPAHFAMWSDARVLRHISGARRSEEEIWQRFLRNQGQWQLMGSGMWALEERATRSYAGSVGFIFARRAIDIPYREAPEMGWVIAPDFHGKGLAREAVAKILAWGDAHLEAAESWCMINPLNLASRQVAAGAGFREAGRARYKDVEMLTFLRPRGAA